MSRMNFLSTLAEMLLAQRPVERPLRIAIDGPLASGKTTLAGELAARMAADAPGIRAGLDGFHRPSAERYRRGRPSPLGYYEDARDYGAIRRELLDPLGPGGSRRYRTTVFDLHADLPLDPPPALARRDAILIVEGTFLQRPEFDGAWDAVVFLDIDPDTSLARGTARDAAALGGLEAAEALYRQRYLPAWKIYVAERDPAGRADIVVDHHDFERPVVLRGKGS